MNLFSFFLPTTYINKGIILQFILWAKWYTSHHYCLGGSIFVDYYLKWMHWKLLRRHWDNLWFSTGKVQWTNKKIKKLWGGRTELYINPTDAWQHLWTGNKHQHSTPILSLTVMWGSWCPRYSELEKHKTEWGGGGGERKWEGLTRNTEADRDG